MHLIHNLWFHYAAPSLRNNGASMILGVLFLPLIKKYLKAESKRARGRLRRALGAAWGAFLAAWGKVAPKATNASQESPTPTTMSAK